MRKNVSTVHVVADDDATVVPALSAELQTAFADVAELAREGLLAMSAAIGLRVMNEIAAALHPRLELTAEPARAVLSAGRVGTRCRATTTAGGARRTRGTPCLTPMNLRRLLAASASLTRRYGATTWSVTS